MDFSQWLFPLSPAGIGTAILCGFIIGFERELSGKTTGIRTSILICMGAYFFTSISMSGLLGDNVDSGRIVAQIITGIGFIGAGVIIGREGVVLGVTTAAAIWVLSAIGIMIGLDRCITAIITSAMTVLLLTGVSFVEYLCKSLREKLHKYSTKEPAATQTANKPNHPKNNQ